MGSARLGGRPSGYSRCDFKLNNLGKAVPAPMLSIVVAMLVIIILAGIVVLYVAFPHRGEDVPHTPWVGDAMRKGVEMLPTLDNQRERESSDV